MKNLAKIVGIASLSGLGFFNPVFSQQINEEYFDSTEYLDERPNPEKNLFPNRFQANFWKCYELLKFQERNELTTSVSDRAFINHNFAAKILYRDINNDGKFDGCQTWLKKNDLTTIRERIELDPEDHSKIERYILFKENTGLSVYFCKIIKKFKDKNISELDLDSQNRIKKLMSMDMSEESLESFLEKEFKEKSDWANPNSENTLYNRVKKLYESPGGLDEIEILRDDEIEYDTRRNSRSKIEKIYTPTFCETYGDKNMPKIVQVRANKNGFPLMLEKYTIRYFCDVFVGKYGFKEKIYSHNTIIRFTEGPGIVKESTGLDMERKNIYYEKKYYKIEKNGKVVELKNHPEEIYVWYKPSSYFSEKDLNRVKEIINSSKSESLIKEFIKKEYAKGGF